MNQEEKLSSLQERIAVNEQSTKTAHARIDQLDLFMREELKDLKIDVKTGLAFLERSKGMLIVITVGAGIIGFIIQLIAGLIFKHQ